MSMPQKDSPKPLVDISSVKVDTTLPQRERIADYVRQIGNPYCYTDGAYAVRFSFSDTHITLEDQLVSYLKGKAEMHY